MDESKRDYVNSLTRGLQVIRAFTRSKSSMTLSEVAEKTGINRAAARRFLLTLVRDGYAETDGKYFRLRPKVLELGFSILASIDISQVVQPILNDLSEQIQESCFAVVLDGDFVVYVARAASGRVVNISINIGSRASAHCMSSGRVLLAGLTQEELDLYLDRVKLEKFTTHTVTSKAKLRALVDQARREGYSVIDQEYEVGFRSISVPITNRLGRTLAALNVTCPTPRVSVDAMKTTILQELLASAKRVSDALPS